MAVADGVHSASLPEVFTALLTDEVETFPALRPHQRHAWHAFLVQLGAMAMHRASVSAPPENAEEWADLMRRLTPDYPDDEPWQLVVEDITQPAFMQPPASSKDKEKEFKNTVETPDELDMLVTAKDHDLKAAVAKRAQMDDWIFALITLQTMEGFGGAGNYGISRMNGGLGSRPAFSLVPEGGLGAHVRRDIEALLEHRPAMLDTYPMTDAGETLLWTLPWDGTSAQALLASQLDPFYIEVCRRIRLRSAANGDLRGVRTSSKAARIASKEMKGRMGDPWTPVDRKGEKCLTLATGGFTYKRVTDYLTSPDWEPPALLRPTHAEQRSTETMQLVARAMVRGQGKTEGYYERTIPIKHKVKMAMLRRAEARELGDIAQTRIEWIRTVQRILSHAIQTFAARGDSDKISPEHRKLARPWLKQLDAIVDARFFDDLQIEFEADESARDGIHNEWLLNVVVAKARRTLHAAADVLSCPAIQRYRARVAAEGLFEGRLRGNQGLPFLFVEEGEEDDDDTRT
jgi:CRISPR system Cascade subunit CasA